MIKCIGPSSPDFETQFENIINPWPHEKLIHTIEIDPGVYIISFKNINKIVSNIYKSLSIHKEVRFILNDSIYYTISEVNTNTNNQMKTDWSIHKPFPIYPCILYKGSMHVDYIVEVTEQILSRL